MDIRFLDSYEEMSQQASTIILHELEHKRKALLCAATGGSPTGTYALLAEQYIRRPDLFSELNIIKLDEWGGIPMSDPGTCEYYLRKYLLKPLQIDDSRYISFNSLCEDPWLECKRNQKELEQRGQIDICILGIGANGHIALNEPSGMLEPYMHPAKLSATTLQHSMVKEMSKKPTFGLTLGIADILKSRMIILLIHGINKKDITQSFLSSKVTTRLPASFLWLHSNVICLLDKSAAAL